MSIYTFSHHSFVDLLLYRGQWIEVHSLLTLAHAGSLLFVIVVYINSTESVTNALVIIN